MPREKIKRDAHVTKRSDFYAPERQPYKQDTRTKYTEQRQTTTEPKRN